LEVQPVVVSSLLFHCLTTISIPWLSDLFMWSPIDGREVYHIKAHTDLISNILYVPGASKNPAVIITCSYDRSIAIWDAHSMERLIHLEEAHSQPIFSIAWSRGDGNTYSLSSSSIDTWSKIWQVDLARMTVDLAQTLIGPKKQGNLLQQSVLALTNTRECRVVATSASTTTSEIVLTNNDEADSLCLWTPSSKNGTTASSYLSYPSTIFYPESHYEMKNIVQALPSNLLIRQFIINQNRIICSIEIIPTESNGDAMGRESIFKQKRGLLCMWKF